MDTRFITYLVKPWDELNELLSKPFAFQPELSDITRLAGSLAVAIRHQPEIANVDKSVTISESKEQKIMRDVADAWKHGILDQPNRRNALSVGAQFECNQDNHFRFLRNIITVDYEDPEMGKFDFMTMSREAIQYWIGKMKLQIEWRPMIAEGPSEFYEWASLYFNPKYQVNMNKTNIKTFCRNPDGDLIPYNPPNVKLAVYEYEKPSPEKSDSR